jgi:ABC-type long-subunit fatty acid transport system fused permease/ATPase subunit
MKTFINKLFMVIKNNVSNINIYQLIIDENLIPLKSSLIILLNDFLKSKFTFKKLW